MKKLILTIAIVAMGSFAHALEGSEGGKDSGSSVGGGQAPEGGAPQDNNGSSTYTPGPMVVVLCDNAVVINGQVWCSHQGSEGGQN